MKKIHVISKTHLDLGFTDYAENVEKMYAESFFPQAIELAKELNTDKKRFIWTTGSWIIENALQKPDEYLKKNLEDALQQGIICPHALAFTTHSELLDEDTFRYSLELAEKLKEKYNLNICAAKMTDVPGHTKSILPLLYEKNIKLLHIGVNEGSAMPKTPQCFVWKNGEAEVIVIYEGSYGYLYKNEHIDDILCFAHSADNHGPNSKENLLDIFQKLETNFPDYEVVASTLDKYAENLWKVKEKLPIITEEIGDSWIHGAASDPYKAGAIRELISMKTKWITEGSLTRGSEEYNSIADSILTLCEHTCGMDVKRHLSDIGIYLKKDFQKAREADIVKLPFFPLKGLKWKASTRKMIRKGVYNQGSYSKIEKSWLEQRGYIEKALESMTDKHRIEANEALATLRPEKGFDKQGYKKTSSDRAFSYGKNSITLNEYGAIKELRFDDTFVARNNNGKAISYVSYGAKDYEYWLKNYSRNLEKTKEWVVPDFARPALKCYDNKYMQGRFSYKLDELFYDEKNSIIATLSTEENLTEELGAPRKIEIRYTIEKEKLIQEVIWLDKDASRLSEALFLHFNFAFDKNNLSYKKIGRSINPYEVVENGNRNLSAIEKAEFQIGERHFTLKNHHSPLAALGEGKILLFDNKYESIAEHGLAFNLYNNVWGTNFPLWYSENAYFKFEIS